MATKNPSPATSSDVPALRRLRPKSTGSLLRLREGAYSDGALPARYKLLTSLAISAVIKCDPCIAMYAQKAAQSGVTVEELGEILDVVMAMAGCPGEAWAEKVLGYYRSSLQGVGMEPVSPGSSHACCD